jgi:hypothetical protein
MDRGHPTLAEAPGAGVVMASPILITGGTGMADLVRGYLQVYKKRRLILPSWIPGKAARAIRGRRKPGPRPSGGAAELGSFPEPAGGLAEHALRAPSRGDRSGLAPEGLSGYTSSDVPKH